MAWGQFSGRDGSGGTFAWLVDAVSGGNAMGVQQATEGSPLGQGTVSVTTSSTSIAAQNTSRKRIEVSNGGTTQVWVVFGTATASSGTGNLLPPGAKDVYYTTAAVKGISVTSANTVGYTEW